MNANAESAGGFPSAVPVAFRLPTWAGMTVYSAARSRVAQRLRVLLAAALVLLVPLALCPVPSDALRSGIFDDDDDMDDDVLKIQVDHGPRLAADRDSLVGVPVARSIACFPVAIGPGVMVCPGRAADGRAPPRV